MGLLTSTDRYVRKSLLPILVLLGTFALATTPGFAASQAFETIRATWFQAGNTIDVTLIVYNYTTSADLQLLSTAFQSGQDRELATALSKIKAVGRCSMSGNLSIDVAFIQMAVTPTGRQIIFIANRPLQPDEVSTSPDSESFDLMVGEFDMNDTDNTRSTGFLYPASKLVVDEQGKFHYDLAGSPWSLSNLFDSNWATAVVEDRTSEETDPPAARSSLP